MNVDLEALCKTYLISLDSEFCEIMDNNADFEKAEHKMDIQLFDKDVSEEEAEELATIFRCGIMKGMVEVFSVFMGLIGYELGKEQKEFTGNGGPICPKCGAIMQPDADFVPIMNSLFLTSRECHKCGYKHEFPKAMLVRDIFTEYTNKQKEAEQ